ISCWGLPELAAGGDASLASHARGRWFETSRAHGGNGSVEPKTTPSDSMTRGRRTQNDHRVAANAVFRTSPGRPAWLCRAVPQHPLSAGFVTATRAAGSGLPLLAQSTTGPRTN